MGARAPKLKIDSIDSMIVPRGAAAAAAATSTTRARSKRTYSTFIQRGLPLVLTTVVGWLGLSQFVAAKLDVQDSQRVYVDTEDTDGVRDDRDDRDDRGVRDVRDDRDVRGVRSVRDVTDLPVEKQRAKAFDLEAELERIRAKHLSRREDLVNKDVPR